MRRARAAILGLACAFLPAISNADCAPPAGPGVLAAFCPSAGALRVLLMPEESAELDAAPVGAVTVTAAYTATDRRAGGLPKPVGLFVHGGRAVNLELGRMDGLLIVDPDGNARIAAVQGLTLDGAPQDLTTLAGRQDFAKALGGRSALQSHLLISDGAVDAWEVEGAPRFRRRLLFQRADGAVGLWQSNGAVTLHEAAVALAEAQAPAMAINLDMGSYDFCERQEDAGPSPCGVVAREGTGKLSNLIRLSP